MPQTPKGHNGFPEGGMSDSAKRRLVADFVEEHIEQPQWYDEFELIHGGSPAPFPEESARVSGYGGWRSMGMGSASDGGPGGQAPVTPASGYRISFKEAPMYHGLVVWARLLGARR